MNDPKYAFAVALTFTLVAMAPVRAQAQPPGASVDDARQHYKRGVDLYAEANYAAALIEFRRAYELAPNYSVLYNIGQIQYQIHDYADALRTFTQYLQQGGAGVPGARKTEVEKEIAYLRDRVGYVDLTTSAEGADVTVDGTSVGKTPLTQPIIVTVGRRRIELVKNDRILATRQLDVASGDHVKVELNEPKAAATAASPSSTPREPGTVTPAPANVDHPTTEDEGRGPLPAILWTTAGAFAIGTVVTGVLALGAASDLSTKREADGARRADLDSAQSKAKTLGLVTDILGAVTVVAVGTATYFTLAPRPQHARGPEVQVRVGGGGVSLAGTF